MQYIKIPLFNHTMTYENDESGVYSEEGQHGYVFDKEADNTEFIGNSAMAYLRKFIVDEPIEIPRVLQPEPFLSVDEPKPPVETVGLLEALDGLTRLADAMRSDGQTFPSPETIVVNAPHEEGSGS